MARTTILIVEDEAIIAADLASNLRALGYEVVATTARGDEAIALAKDRRPDLVLMDIQLAGSIDGVAAARAIREQCDLPVIYLTAHSDSATLKRAKITEPFGYILKPFEQRDLETNIEMALYRHNAERQFRDQREWLRVTLTSIGDAVITSDNDGRVTFLNPVAAVLTGWPEPEAIGQPVQRVFQTTSDNSSQSAEDIVVRVLREGRIVALANNTVLRARDGREIPIEDSAAPIRDGTGKVIGIVIVFHDVTDKRRSQEALRISQERLATFANATFEGIIESEEGRIVDCNEQFAQMLGYQPEELRGVAIEDLTVPEDRPRVMANIRLGRDSITEQGMIRKDGTHVIVEAHGRPVVSPGPRRHTAVRDITVRRRQEEELRKLNRNLRALSNSSQAVMRAEEEKDLLQQVCQIIVRDCGHLMAWIGLAENDDVRSVRPAAHAGFEEGYLKTLHLTWADTERGRGPTGTAIRTGQPTMCQNMLTDPRFAPWREEALKRGYSSSLVLPLLADGNVLGAINIYSQFPERFSRDEVELLSELAGDLAHGILTLRLRKAHRQAEAALRQAKEDWEHTFDAVPDLIAILDNSHHILRANSAMAARLHLSPEQCAGQLCYVCMHGADGPPAVCPHRLTVADGQEHLLELNEPRLGGDFLVSTTPLRDATGAIVGSVHVARDITSLKRAEDALRQARDQLEQKVRERTSELLAANNALRIEMAERLALESRVLDVSQAEQRRLGQDLHDGVCQQLAGIAYLGNAMQERLVRIAPGEVGGIAKIIRLIQDANTQAHGLARGLDPIGPGKAGLVPAFRDLVVNMRKYYPIAVRFECPEPIVISGNAVATHLYRIGQEAMNNAAKHSEATRITIRLVTTRDALILTVKDNGHGLKASRPPSDSMGLEIMHYRARTIGATLNIHSDPKQGTVLTCTLPLSSAPAASASQ